MKGQIEVLGTNHGLRAFEKFKVQARKKSNINRASLKWKEMGEK